MIGTYKEKFTINLVSNEDTIDVEVLNVGTTLLGGKKELHVGRGQINIHEAIRSNNIATNLVVSLLHEPKSYKKGIVKMTGTINDAQLQQTATDVHTEKKLGSSVAAATDVHMEKKPESSVAGKSNDEKPETNKKTEPTPASGDDDGDDDDDELKILPVNGSQKYFITKIIAKDIKNAEILGSNDNFLLLNIGNKWSVETSVVEGSGSAASWSYALEKDKQMTIELSNQEVPTYYVLLTFSFILTHSSSRSLVIT